MAAISLFHRNRYRYRIFLKKLNDYDPDTDFDTD